MKVFEYGKGKSDSKAKDYKGERTASGIVSFLSDMAGKADIEPDVHELINQRIYNEECQGTVICMINFLPNIYESSASDRKKYLETIMSSAKTNRKQPFRWFWLQSGDQLDLERQLNLGFGFPALIAVAPTKKMIATMRSSFSPDNLNEFTTNLLIGKGGLENLSQEIKIKKVLKWDGKDAAPIVEEDLSMYEDILSNEDLYSYCSDLYG